MIQHPTDPISMHSELPIPQPLFDERSLNLSEKEIVDLFEKMMVSFNLIFFIKMKLRERAIMFLLYSLFVVHVYPQQSVVYRHIHKVKSSAQPLLLKGFASDVVRVYYMTWLDIVTNHQHDLLLF